MFLLLLACLSALLMLPQGRPLEDAAAAAAVQDSGTVAASSAAVPVQGYLPSLQPLISPLRPFLGRPVAATLTSPTAQSTTTAAPLKGVLLARQHYSRTTAAAAASSPIQAAATKCHTDARPIGGCPQGIDYYAPNPVMHTVKLVPMFYGTWTANQKALITAFLSGLGGSRWMGINALYSDTTGFSSNAPGMYSGQSVTFSTTTMGASLNESQVVDLVQQGISTLTGAAVGAGGDTNTIYMLLTGPDINQVIGANFPDEAFCKTFCAWHSYYTQDDGVDVNIAWAGNAISLCPQSCIAPG